MAQNQVNADFPDDQNPPRDPPPFPAAVLGRCLSMSVRVYHPTFRQSQVVTEVLIPDNTESDDEDFEGEEEDSSNRAYWLQSEIMEAIYGSVRLATILRRRTDVTDDPNAQWEVTNERCAVKQMSRVRIQQNQGRLAENPLEEVNAMQYILRSLMPIEGNAEQETLERVMNESNVLLPLDVLYDDRHLYSIMPYCNGGELFTRLDENTRFTEPQARYWMRQILQGISSLQHVGICHRDMSLENVLIHNKSCFIMDFGMCCRVPYKNIPPNSDEISPPETRGDRQLLKPYRTMGKWSYMSPEIERNRDPFDGYAVDLWGVGAMLFTMVAGFHPWERPSRAEQRFLYLTGGYLENMLTEWNLGLSSAILDLLQKMLFYDPRDRLSLSQILEHPWMLDEDEPPQAREEWG